ncbi:MAG: DUF4373 domain-containing protein [Ruminococcaceae bacterium]|nr:DUF4373 domain-containing protein [Oscillospiraceae bacterium]
MAGRPLKSGVDYWPFDVGLLYDDKFKLIRGEFGAKGVLIALFALNSCYKKNGYFRAWSDDDAILLAEEVGCGCSFGLVQQVIRACVARSLFDKRVFDMHHVLTSVGIQRRYLRIVAKNRLVIPLFSEYWVLPKEEIPPDTLVKCSFKNINGTEKSIFHTEKGKNSTEKHINQTKQNQTDFSLTREDAAVFGCFKNVRLYPEEYDALKEQIPDADTYIERFSERKESKHYHYPNDFAAILSWYREDSEKERQSGKQEPKGSFDVDDFWEAAMSRTYGGKT